MIINFSYCSLSNSLEIQEEELSIFNIKTIIYGWKYFLLIQDITYYAFWVAISLFLLFLIIIPTSIFMFNKFSDIFLPFYYAGIIVGQIFGLIEDTEDISNNKKIIFHLIGALIIFSIFIYLSPKIYNKKIIKRLQDTQLSFFSFKSIINGYRKQIRQKNIFNKSIMITIYLFYYFIVLYFVYSTYKIIYREDKKYDQVIDQKKFTKEQITDIITLQKEITELQEEDNKVYNQEKKLFVFKFILMVCIIYLHLPRSYDNNLKK